MPTVKNPLLFSTHFDISPDALKTAGLIDPFLDVDIPLFIDPILLGKSANEWIKTSAVKNFRQHFETLIRLLAISEIENDAPWKAAQRQLNLSEPAENGLGYGGSGRSGSSRPDRVREAILRTSKEIVKLGARDPEMISLMGFFEEDVGPDTISDLTTTVVMRDLAALTEDFCSKNNIPVFKFEPIPEHKLPRFKSRRGRYLPLVLVPDDIVRELPIANDWSDIERAAMENARIREKVNQHLAGIAQPTIIERKAALRSAALGSSDDFDFFLAAVKENARHYDPNVDTLGYFKLKEILAKGFLDTRQPAGTYNLSAGPQEILRVVTDSIHLFKRHIEAGNLWEELWVGERPKRERAAQLIYYAIADAYCKANDIDISPEAHMGGGPIDFKFSHGYKARVLVEMKRSGGTVVHGYKKQLEFYKAASQTDYAVFVVIDYGDLGHKLSEIQKVRNARAASGQRASEIVVIDATPKASASKRQ